MAWAWKKDLSLGNDNDLAWESYNEETSARIEYQYQLNPKGSYAVDSTYKIDFDLMIQYRMDDTNRQRAVRRKDIPVVIPEEQTGEGEEGVPHASFASSAYPVLGDGDGEQREGQEGVPGEGIGHGEGEAGEGIPSQNPAYLAPNAYNPSYVGVEKKSVQAPTLEQEQKLQALQPQDPVSKPSISAKPSIPAKPSIYQHPSNPSISQKPSIASPSLVAPQSQYQPGTPKTSVGSVGSGAEGKLEGKQSFSSPPASPSQNYQPQNNFDAPGSPSHVSSTPIIDEGDEKHAIPLGQNPSSQSALLDSKETVTPQAEPVPVTLHKPKPVLKKDRSCTCNWARWGSILALIVFFGGVAEELREFLGYVNTADYVTTSEYRDIINAVVWCIMFSVCGMLGWCLWMALLTMSTFVTCFYTISCLGVITMLVAQTHNLRIRDYDLIWLIFFSVYIAAEVLGLAFWRIVIPISKEFIPIFALEMLTGFYSRWQVLIIGLIGFGMQIFVILVSAYHFIHHGFDAGRVILFLYLMEFTRNLIHYTSVRVYINMKYNYERRSMPILSELWLAVSRRLFTIMFLSLFTQFEAGISIIRKVVLSIVWGPCADKCSVCVLGCGKVILSLTDKILKFVARFTVTMAAYGSLGPCAAIITLDRHDIGEMFTWWEFEPITKSLCLGAICFSCVASMFADRAVKGSGIFFYVAAYYLFRTLTEPLEALNNSNQLVVRNEKSHQGEAQLQQVNSKPYTPLQTRDNFFVNPFLIPPQDNYFYSCPRCHKHFQTKKQLIIADRIKCVNTRCDWEHTLQITDVFPWRFPFGIAYNPTRCCCLCRETDSHWKKIVVEELYFYKTKIRPTMLDSRQCIFRSIVDSFNSSKYLSENYSISKVALLDNPEIRAKFENYIADNKCTHARLADQASIRELDAFRKHTVFRLQDLIVVKGWHGCHWQNANSIAAKGFMNLKTTDDGFFGSGVYFAPQLEYAVRYSTGQLVSGGGKGYRPNMSGEFCVLMSFLAIAKPYYITWGRDGDYKSGSRCKHVGKPIVDGFDAHYVRVDKSFLLPEPSGQPVYEEIVLKDAALQALPTVALYYKLKNQKEF